MSAVVTGASGVLGSSIARALDAAGYSVAVLYHSGDGRAQAVAADLANPSLVASVDVREWRQCEAVAEKTYQILGPVQVVVNCGGMRCDALLAGQSPDEWRQVIEVNLLGTFHVTRAYLPRMLAARRGGAIVNIVSPAGVVASAGQTAYSASKAGVIGMTRSLAREVAKRNITVNAVSPGFMLSPLTEGLPQAARDSVLERAAIRRPIPPDHVVRAVLAVINNPSMTGQVVAVDGGLAI